MRIPADTRGFRGDPKWRDMADYLFHSTKGDALLCRPEFCAALFRVAAVG